MFPTGNLANLVTITRIIVAVVLLCTVPLTVPFWVAYTYCGLSDVLDGALARTLKQQSAIGARLDSIADLVFVFSASISIIPAVALPVWLWVWVAIIGVTRVTAYAIGYGKYRTFPALHTYANKAAGAVLFCAPFVIQWLGIAASGTVVCLVASLAAIEELLITASSHALDRDRTGLFSSPTVPRPSSSTEE